jgi:nucleotide-binding universal stress UspA family protein
MARGGASRTLRRIVHASDFSGASRPAFRQAVDLARRSGAELVIAHVLAALPMLPDASVAATTYGDLLDAQRADGQKRLDRLVAQAKAAGARVSGTLRDFAVAADAIARLAKTMRADVIVIGTHGRTGFRRALMGSVAARIIATAPCPVLTVRA